MSQHDYNQGHLDGSFLSGLANQRAQEASYAADSARRDASSARDSEHRASTAATSAAADSSRERSRARRAEAEAADSYDRAAALKSQYAALQTQHAANILEWRHVRDCLNSQVRGYAARLNIPEEEMRLDYARAMIRTAAENPAFANTAVRASMVTRLAWNDKLQELLAQLAMAEPTLVYADEEDGRLPAMAAIDKNGLLLTWSPQGVYWGSAAACKATSARTPDNSSILTLELPEGGSGLRNLVIDLRVGAATRDRWVDMIQAAPSASAGQGWLSMSDELSQRVVEFRHAGTYAGKSDRGMRMGTGRHEWSDGSCYEGVFATDALEGQAITRFANGAVFEGEFYGGSRNGPGRHDFSKTKEATALREGVYKDGTLARGRIVMKDGLEFSGGFAFENNMYRLDGPSRVDYSKVRDSKLLALEGDFSNGMLQGRAQYRNGAYVQGKMSASNPISNAQPTIAAINAEECAIDYKGNSEFKGSVREGLRIEGEFNLGGGALFIGKLHHPTAPRASEFAGTGEIRVNGASIQGNFSSLHQFGGCKSEGQTKIHLPSDVEFKCQGLEGTSDWAPKLTGPIEIHYQDGRVFHAEEATMAAGWNLTAPVGTLVTAKGKKKEAKFENGKLLVKGFFGGFSEA